MDEYGKKTETATDCSEYIALRLRVTADIAGANDLKCIAQDSRHSHSHGRYNR